METIRKISKRYYLRQMVIWAVVNVMFWGLPFGAFAMPTGGNVVRGHANITDLHNMLIDGQAVINWTGFNTTDSEWVAFDKMGDLGGYFAVLNRISGGKTSFMGDLYGHNGLVILSNPSGICFGPKSLIQARSFAAIGFDIDPDAFMAQGIDFDPLNFEYSGPGGEIILERGHGWCPDRATIEVSEDLALIGKKITNKGLICVKDPDHYSYVVMAAGDSVKIGRENSHVNVDVTASEDNYELLNEGELHTGDAEGKVSLVLAAGDIYSTAIDGVESLRAKAVYKGDFEDIDVYADAGSDAVAEVDIATGSSLTIDHSITAEAVGDEENDAIASISLTSEHGSVYIGDHRDTKVRATARNGLNNTAAVDILADGDVDITACCGDAKVIAEAYRGCTEPVSNQANVNITAGGDVHVKSEGGDEGHGCCGGDFTPYVASVEAAAHDALNSNDAGVDITAGGDVVVLSEDGGEARVEAYAGNCFSSHNTANVNLTAEDGYVLVHAIGGHYDCRHDEFTPSEAAVRATAEYAGVGEGDDISTNDAAITIVARDIVEPADLDSDTDLDVILSVEDSDSDSDVDCSKDGDVMVVGVQGGKAEVEAIAKDGGENSAGVSIDADSDVEVIALCEGQPSQAEIMALAKDADVSNTALVDITAGDNVEVLAENGGKAEIESIAKDGPTNQADVDIDAGGEVIVKAEGGLVNEWTETIVDSYNVNIKHKVEVPDTYDIYLKKRNCRHNCSAVIRDFPNSHPTDAELEAEGYDPDDGWYIDHAHNNHDGYSYWETFTIEGCPISDPDPADYDHAGWVYDWDHGHYYTVNSHEEDHSSFETPSVASIKAIAEDDLQSNTANILINAGDDVKVMAFDGGVAEMIAETEDGELNSSGITINSNGDVKVLAIGYTETTEDGKTASKASVEAKAKDGLENTASIELGGPGHSIGGDVLVLGKYGGEAEIKAKAEKGNTNEADVLICTEGWLDIIGKCGGEAEVKAKAERGYSNTAKVGIGAVEGVLVKGEYCGDAEILAKAEHGFTNKAETIVCTKGDLLVNGLKGYAAIGSEALDGYYTDAYTGVCATGDIAVIAGIDPEYINPEELPLGGIGGEAYVYSEAESKCYEPVGSVSVQSDVPTIQLEEPTTAKARTVAVSKEGGVVVADFTGYYQYQGSNDSAGITADAYNGDQTTASVGVAAGSELTPTQARRLQEEGDILAGNVIVYAQGPWSDARIMSHSVGSYNNESSSTADTVICAPGEVYVYAGAVEGRPLAKIKALAEGGEFNTATTQVYASDVEVDVPGLYRGNGVGAWAMGGEEGWIHVDSQYCLTEDGSVGITDGQSTLIIDTYAKRKDCPECPPCPCEQEVPPVTPDAALYTEAGEPLEPYEFEQGGCPALMQWFANEVGLPLDQIHVMLSNADYLATDVQPCNACARLKQQSETMAMDTAAVGAWASTVRAGLVGPITPEMMDGIRTALADNPAALGFDEAAAQYVKILSDELGFERDDAVAVMTGKYAPDYSDLGAYINARAGM